MAKRLLNAKEVIQEYGGFKTEYELWRRAREGQVPAIAVGRRVLFERSTLDRWIEQGGTPSRRPDDKRGPAAA